MEDIKKNILSKAFLYISLLTFIAFVAYILHINQEVLYTAHDRSEFIFGASFFHTLMQKPFGLMQYVGAWLTQLFYHPALGAGVLVAIWALIFCVGVKAFRLHGNSSALMLLPIACLLTSIVDLGYWIYIFNIKGYWFSQSAGYLVMLLLLWAARCTSRKWHLAWYVVAVCLYPILGCFSLLFILCLAFSERPTWRELIGIVMLLFTASIWRTLLYSNQNFNDILLAGIPRFETPNDSSKYLTIPFWVLGAVSVIIAFGRLGGWSFSRLGGWSFSRLGDSESGRLGVRLGIPVLCVAAGIIFTLSFMFRDRNYIDEMRMVRYAETDNWHEILNIAAQSPKPSHSMLMLRNVAMMNDGGLLESAFKQGNNGTDINNTDSLHVSFMNIAAPLVFYNYGKMNYATRLCFENIVPTGFSPFYLKILSRCARATGEEKLVERYTTLLHHNLFYGGWQPAPTTKTVSELQKAFVDEINGVENNCELYIIDNFSFASDTVSKAVSEQALFYSMIRRDSRCFWSSLRRYVKLHPNEKFPLHAQEAYIMYMDKSPEEKRIILPVEQNIYNRYIKFGEAIENALKRGMKREEIGAKLEGEWADTYWWFNIFGLDAY